MFMYSVRLSCMYVCSTYGDHRDLHLLTHSFPPRRSSDLDPNNRAPTPPVDHIARYYSITKPITTVAAMTLLEQGVLQLDDPVAKYIPEFADTPVYVSGPYGDMRTEAQRVPINRKSTRLNSSH